MSVPVSVSALFLISHLSRKEIGKERVIDCLGRHGRLFLFFLPCCVFYLVFFFFERKAPEAPGSAQGRESKREREREREREKKRYFFVRFFFSSTFIYTYIYIFSQ